MSVRIAFLIALVSGGVSTLVARFVETKKWGYKSFSWVEAFGLGLVSFVCILAFGLYQVYRSTKSETFVICPRCEEAMRGSETINGDCPKCKNKTVPLHGYYRSED